MTQRPKRLWLVLFILKAKYPSRFSTPSIQLAKCWSMEKESHEAIDRVRDELTRQHPEYYVLCPTAVCAADFAERESKTPGGEPPRV